MTYRIQHMIAAMALGIVIGALLVGAGIADANGANNRRDNAQGIAQCIAEYDYTHPGRNRFNILVRAIRACKVATAHECVAPCTVVLPRGTLEDEFGINFGWRNRHTSIVDVYVKGRR